MKKHILLGIFYTLGITSSIYGQNYVADNRVFLKFETTKGGTVDFYAPKMSTRFMLDLGQIEMEVDVKTFKKASSRDTLFELKELLNYTDYEEITFKSSLPSPIQVQTNTPQRMMLNGQLFIGNTRSGEAMNITFMPKDQSELEFEFVINTELNDFKIDVPERLKSKITGRFKVIVINGRSVGRP